MATYKEITRKIFATILVALVTLFSGNFSYAVEYGDEVHSSLQGTITDENSHPVEGALIQIGTYSPELGFRLVSSASTNKEGEYSIPDYTLTAGDAISVILFANGHAIVNKWYFSQKTFNYQIPSQRATLTGKVTYPDMYQTPAEAYPVYLTVYLGRGGGRINIASTLTDSNGNYAFSIIPGSFDSVRGENNFQLFFGENHFEVGNTLHLGDRLSVNHQEFNVPPGVKLNGRIYGFITDENKVPIDDAAVHLVGVAPTTPVGQGGLFVSDIIRGGHYTLRVTAPGFLPFEESIHINGGDTHLELKLVKVNPPHVTAIADRYPDHNGWYNKDVIISFQATDNDSIISIDPPKVVSTEGIEQVIEGMATDNLGLTGVGLIKINLDKTAPVTTAFVLENENHNNWYNTDVNVTLVSTDNLSDVEAIQYSFDNGGTWHNYSESFNISEEGKNVILYRSIDKAGNIEQPRSLEINIDKTPPKLSVTLDRYMIAPPNRKMVTVNATVIGSDITSGLNLIELLSITSNELDNEDDNTSDGVQNAEYGTFDTSFDLRATRSGKGDGRFYTITYLAMDKAGNVITETQNVLVPKGVTK